MKGRQKRTREEALNLEPAHPPFDRYNNSNYPLPKKLGWLLVALGTMVLVGLALKITGGGETEWSILIIMTALLMLLVFLGFRIILVPNARTARAELEAAELEHDSEDKDLFLNGEAD